MAEAAMTFCMKRTVPSFLGERRQTIEVFAPHENGRHERASTRPAPAPPARALFLYGQRLDAVLQPVPSVNGQQA